MKNMFTLASFIILISLIDRGLASSSTDEAAIQKEVKLKEEVESEEVSSSTDEDAIQKEVQLKEEVESKEVSSSTDEDAIQKKVNQYRDEIIKLKEEVESKEHFKKRFIYQINSLKSEPSVNELVRLKKDMEVEVGVKSLVSEQKISALLDEIYGSGLPMTDDINELAGLFPKIAFFQADILKLMKELNNIEKKVASSSSSIK